MAVNYKVYQNKRKGEFKDKFYARATHGETVTIKQLAEKMQANCTVKKSDIIAVLTELSEVMKDDRSQHLSSFYRKGVHRIQHQGRARALPSRKHRRRQRQARQVDARRTAREGGRGIRQPQGGRRERQQGKPGIGTMRGCASGAHPHK